MFRIPGICKCANKAKADVVKDYVGWAIGKGYAVIDVNIPKHVTTEPVSSFTLYPSLNLAD